MGLFHVLFVWHQVGAIRPFVIYTNSKLLILLKVYQSFNIDISKVVLSLPYKTNRNEIAKSNQQI